MLHGGEPNAEIETKARRKVFGSDCPQGSPLVPAPLKRGRGNRGTCLWGVGVGNRWELWEPASKNPCFQVSDRFPVFFVMGTTLVPLPVPDPPFFGPPSGTRE